MTNQEIAVEIVRLGLDSKIIEPHKVFIDGRLSDTIVSYHLTANVEYMFIFGDDGDSIEPTMSYGGTYKTFKVRNVTKVIALFRSMK